MGIRSNRSKKILAISGAVIVLYALVGFFLVPVLGKNIIREKLAEALNREVTLERMTVNPFSLTAGMEGLKIMDKDKDVFVSANKIFINLSAASPFILTPSVSEISLEKPYIKIVQNADGSFNFSDLMEKDNPQAGEDQAKDEDKKGIFGFVLKNVQIIGGEIDFEDKKANVTHQIKDFSFLLPLLSSRQKDVTHPANSDIQFVFNGAKGGIRLDSTPFADDLTTKAVLKISDVNVTHYLAYLPLPENLRLTSFDLGLDLHAEITRKDSKLSLVIGGKVDAANVDVIGNGDEPILSFPSLSIDISDSDILSGQLNVSKVLLSSPKLNLERDKNGGLTLLGYIPKASPAEENTKGRPFVFFLDDLEIKEAVIAFKDPTNKTPFETTLSPLNLTVTRLKSGEAMSGEFQMNFTSLSGETFDSKGEFQTGPVKAKGSLSLGNLLINRYAPYYENLVNFDIRDGALNLALDFDMSKDENRMMITNREISIQSLSVMDRKAKEEMIHIPEFKITGSTLDMENRTLDTGTITAQKGKILIKRDEQGRINLAEAFSADGKTQKTVPSGKTGRPPDKSDKSDKPDTPEPQPDSPWSVTLNTFDAIGFDLSFKDLSLADAVNIELSDISVKAEAFGNSGKEKGKLNTRMTWGKNGKIEISGDVNPLGQTAGLDINLEKIDIQTLQPYFGDAVKILVTDGNINLKGKLLMDMQQKSGEILHFAGETSVAGFSSLDKKTKQDFFNCNSLYLTGLDISLFPVEINAKEISLTDFYSKIMVSESGELNVSSIFKSDAPRNKTAGPLSAKPSAEKKPKINIEKVTLQGGNIDFSDYLTKPNYKADMKEIAGSLTGLSSKEESRAKLHLQGVHGASSPLEILGTINPLAEKKFAEINVSFKDIELSNFTPYASKYLGYKIEKGKLILDLKYLIDGNVLKSENRARFDNFELGEKVDSKHATSLPIGLAISLLKNRAGQIDLDLPVEGRLDDPEFKLGSIILKMIGNMILKVITSPFSILGSLFGGGEELSFVEFEFGEGRIKESEHEKIDKLAEILKEKPSIKLEIQGVYNPIRDGEGIREKRFEVLLKEERSRKEWYSLSSPKAVTEPLTPEEKEKYIEKVYDKAEFPKPRDEKGGKKKLDLEEKKKLLITHITVDENDLRSLALTRAENTKAYILSLGKVEKERIFLLEPSAVKKEETDQAGRVNFSLK
ncbi:MAG: hypothetical protein A3J85_02480 [Desulfobacula sp. RIFOXYA12_FULL_46_16]|nr:MAG: hypothetical protein A3J85_02480 [Desulfobacula sp. RIFOXYA12_FULL_46_16]